PEDAGWLNDAEGRAVKMVSLLLYRLPPDRFYKIIFLRRKLGEILLSQEKMLARSGRASAVSSGVLRERFEEHLAKLETWLSTQKNISVFHADYNAILVDPRPRLDALNAFLGGGLDVGRMAAVVDPSLYRARG
ncbi:MAG: sulfotransferase family protein, partial [Planctomycetota bacterium]